MAGRITGFLEHDEGSASDMTLIVAGMVALAITVASMTLEGSETVGAAISQSLTESTVAVLVFNDS